MEDVVTVGPESVGLDGTSVYLRENETITLKELCLGLMLSSGNDAAMAIAVHLGGSQEGFAALMNERARQIGALDTNFVTPNGLPAEGHYTTAHDLALIAAEAMQNELFCEIVGTQTMTLEGDEDSPTRYLRSKNKILYNYEGGNGVKTGYTKAAGRCLVSAARQDGVTLVCVTLNDPNDWADHQALYEAGFARGTVWMQQGETLSLPLVGGAADTVTVAAKETLKTYDSGEAALRVLAEPFYYAPVEEGAVLGTAELWQGDTLLGTTELVCTAGAFVSSSP